LNLAVKCPPTQRSELAFVQYGGRTQGFAIEIPGNRAEFIGDPLA
jgi:hypothetical protein